MRSTVWLFVQDIQRQSNGQEHFWAKWANLGLIILAVQYLKYRNYNTLKLNGHAIQNKYYNFRASDYASIIILQLRFTEEEEVP